MISQHTLILLFLITIIRLSQSSVKHINVTNRYCTFLCKLTPIHPMTKIYPSFSQLSKYSSSFNHISSRPETFTIWMKSLVLNGNGCTVYNSKGQIAYRVDNYDHKCRREVYLMNLDGKILFKIVKKKHRICGRWEGYGCNDGLQGENSRPWFKVKKPCCILRGFQPLYCEVSVDADHIICCKINKTSNSSYKIVGISGEHLAEVKRKHTKSGIDLGDDVLTLVVEPNIDHSLIMGMVVVHGLMKFYM